MINSDSEENLEIFIEIEIKRRDLNSKLYEIYKDT